MTETTALPMSDRMAYYRDYHRNIMHLDCSDLVRDFKLTTLMNKMEIHFRIPMLNNAEYNRKNPDVIALYRQVSSSRVTI